ncbi:MAG: GNAT family N-acetyltransferase [Bacteroidales bacterium]|nr:GNAT family N-acetyltransferase [Bacteroidales bacterium]
MLKIKQINNTDFEKEYFSLVEKFYKKEEGFAYYISDLKKGLNYTLKSEFQETHFFCVYKEDKIAGTAGLIIDSRLETNSCFLGFFEVIDDKEVFDNLWNELTTFAKSMNKGKILGPVNGSIWHQYRVFDKDLHKKRFPSEPITQNFYVDFLKSKNPTYHEEYHSAFRTNFDVIMLHTKESYENALKKNVEIEKLKEFDIEFMKVLFAFSNHIFSQSWGFVPLNFNEFIELYSTEKIKDFIGSVHVAKYNSQIIGFCLNIETDDSLIMKTIAVVPDFQQKGVGNALVYAVHNDAKQNNKKYLIYALINKKNKIQYFPQDEVTIMREYVAFEFGI